MKIEISKKSYRNPNKKKNGDFCDYKVLENKQLADEKSDDTIHKILNDENLSNIGNLKLTSAILTGIENGIEIKNSEILNKILAVVQNRGIDLGRQNLTNFISLMSRFDFQDRATYQMFLKLLRGSRF